MHATALFLAASIAVSCLPMGAAQGIQGPPPALQPGQLQEIRGAIDAIAREVSSSIAGHPELFPAAAEAIWNTTFPAAPMHAYRQAVWTLADARVRIALGIAAGPDRPTLPANETSIRLQAFHATVKSEAAELLANANGHGAPGPSPALEDALFRWLPVFQAVGEEGRVAVLASSVRIEPGQAIREVLAAATALEASRVSWEHIKPILPEATRDSTLTRDHVHAVLANATYAGSENYSDTSRRLASLARAEQVRRHAFGELGFVLAAEREFVRYDANVRASSFGLDVQPWIDAEASRLAGGPHTLLSVQAWELVALPQAAAGDAASRALAQALGESAVVRLVRGQSDLSSKAVATWDGNSVSPPGGDDGLAGLSSKGTPGLPPAVFVAACVLAACVNRRMRGAARLQT